MKKTLIFLFLISNFILFSQEDYQIEIDGKKYNIELDKSYNLKINNKNTKVIISQKDTLTYKDDKISFKYLKEFKIVSTTIETGIEQLMLMTAEGSGIIIQKHDGINPTFLNEMMINEVTKESINYGFELQRQDYDYILKSGQKIRINKAYLTYRNDVNIYEVASIGNRDEGVLLMSMEMSDTFNTKGKQLIKMFWETLEVF